MDFTPVVLVLLAIAWGAAALHWLRTRDITPSLAPALLGRRRGGSFSVMSATPPRSNVLPLHGPEQPLPQRAGHSLTDPARTPLLGPPAGLSSHGPQPYSRGRVTAEQARLRRRNVLVALAGAAALTLFAALAFGGTAVVVHLVADALLLGFVLVLVQYQREIEIERTRRLPVYAPPSPLAPTGTDGSSEVPSR